MTTQPMLISGGKAHPITAAQYAAARRHQPIGPVAGVTPPRAASPAVPAPAPQPKPDPRALSRASMLAEVGKRYGEDARATAAAGTGRPQGVDPKAATIGQPQPKAPAMDGRRIARESMLKVIGQRHGEAERAKAEARLAARAR